MNKQLWVSALLAVCLMSAISSAQKLERTKNWEVGDKATWNYVLKGRPMRLVEEVVEVTDAEIRSTLRFADPTYEQTVSTRDSSTALERSDIFTELAAATGTASWRRSNRPSAPTRRRTTPTARCL